MYKVVVFILLFTFLFIFIANCGLEDTSTYFQEPRNLSVVGDSANRVVYFYGYNQENVVDSKNNKYYLFVGYDVYYYFTSSKEALKMNIKNPKLSLEHSTDLVVYDSSSRFSESKYNATYMDEIFQHITIPVTDGSPEYNDLSDDKYRNMIEDILYEGNNDNGRFSFHNHTVNDGTPDLNPYVNSVSNYIFLDDLYPNYNEYKNEEWGKRGDFLGFYDYDFFDHVKDKYDLKEGEHWRRVGDEYYYKIHLYIIAKGFTSLAEKGIFTESIKSERLEFEVVTNKTATEYIP